MTGSSRSDELARLRSEAERSVRSFTLGAMAVASTPTREAARAAGRHTPSSGPARTALAPWPGREAAQAAGRQTPSSGTVRTALAPWPDRPGVTVFPDSERKMRALAKEIRRLIAEDKRRGLAV
jgi:hypothetical protein